MMLKVKAINGYDNYIIDENGIITNTDTNKILNGSIGENGYKYYRLSKNHKTKMFYAHRLVAETFIPNPNNLPVVNHKDGNKLNNNINNLEWCTYSENSKHAHSSNLLQKRRQSEYYKEDLPNEIWKKIYYTHYSVSSFGRVKNDITNLLLKPSIACGYYKVRLSEEGRVTDVIIHKLVYCIFNNIEVIPSGYTIDHINGDKLDNKLTNLRLITLSENVRAALYETKTNKNCIRVGQYDTEGNLIKKFLSIAEATRNTGVKHNIIKKICLGIKESHNGFIFKFLDN